MTPTCPDRSVLLISQTTAEVLAFYAMETTKMPEDLIDALHADGWAV